MFGKAKKSSHKRSNKKALRGDYIKQPKISEEAAAKKKVVEHEDCEYEIAELGAIYPEWGLMKEKNDKGKIITKYFLKDLSEHRIWVRWESTFADQYEVAESDWSAEPQAMFNEEMQVEIQEILKKKVCWPWPNPSEEDADLKRAILLSEGYKESGPEKKKKEGNGKDKWAVSMMREAQLVDEPESDNDEENDKESEDEEDEV